MCIRDSSCAEHTRSLPCGGPMLMIPRVQDDSEMKGKSSTMSSVVSAAAPAVMFAMKGWMAVEGFYTTTIQAVNEYLMLRESKKLQLAQTYFLRDYKDLDETEADKPCLSNQLYN
eukprot:TRINITY_DN44780_c0_g1_i1.p1 TRINITY_DN44780_c0_g1~~TRINITY_DN44780_c0_g1_i1.p1  ORF type:complete len:115 (-),score=28.31 TRINITY_DN44780_c0_g1_i1:71-415(-)